MLVKSARSPAYCSPHLPTMLQALLEEKPARICTTDLQKELIDSPVMCTLESGLQDAEAVAAALGPPLECESHGSLLA